MMSKPAGSLIGRWKGGKYGKRIDIERVAGSHVMGKFKTAEGGVGEIHGILMEGGKRVRGYWTDPDSNITERDKDANTIDIRLGSTMEDWTAIVMEKGKSAPEWRADRYQRRGRSGGAIEPAGPNKHPDAWERLTTPKDKDKFDAMRDQILSDSKRDPGLGRMGLISATSPLCVGDLYKGPASTKSSRHYGTNFSTNPTKKGKVGSNVFFSEAKANGVDCPFKSKSEIAVEAMKKKKALQAIKDRPAFSATNTGGKGKPKGSRDLFLLEVDSMSSMDELKKVKAVNSKSKMQGYAEAREVPIAARQILTNPAKRGGFGVPGTLFSNKDPSDTVIKYKEEGPDTGKARKLAKAKSAALIGDRPAYVPRARRKNNGKFSTDHETFRDMGPGAPVKPPLRSLTKTEGPPFVPVMPAPHVKTKTFQPFPQHVPDPFPETLYKKGDEEAVAKWVPPHPAKAMPYKSVKLDKTVLRRYSAGSKASRFQ